MITLDQLKTIMPLIPKDKVDIYFKFLVMAMDEFKINTPLRMAAFLAQIAHESYEFKYMSEIWGPTEQQLKYEPPNKLAARLGNTQKGDGYLYRGASPIQLTGRSNFRMCGLDLGLDLEGHPDLARNPDVGFRIAGWYWNKRKLNDLADIADFDGITKKVNGGFNGKKFRDNYYIKAKKVLGIT